MHPAVLILMLALAQASPRVCVSTDRGFYSPGDEVTIYVSAAGLNESLWVYVDKPDGHSLYYTELSCRSETINVTLPQDAPDGSYTIIIMWDHRYVQTGFIVESQPVPEFPLPFVVFFIAFAIATLALAGRKASASAETPSAHSRAHSVH
jgi:hypothetical protein